MFQFYYCFIFTLFQMGTAQYDIGKGAWNVLDLKFLEKDGYEFVFDLNRKKITRTEDAYSGKLTFRRTFDNSYKFRAEIYKWLDGGKKLYHVLTDDSFVHFIEKNAMNNSRRAFEMVGLDPPAFPIPKGEYEIKDFIFNYCEMPEDGPCGKYTANVYAIKNTMEVAGLTMEAEFECADDHKCATEE